MISVPSSPTNESFQDPPQSSESQYFPETRSILDDPNDFTNFDYETQDWKATIGDMDRSRHLPPLRQFREINNVPILTSDHVYGRNISVVLGAILPLRIEVEAGKRVISAARTSKHKCFVFREDRSPSGYNPLQPLRSPSGYNPLLLRLRSVVVSDIVTVKTTALCRYRVMSTFQTSSG